jgi:lipoprotein NlpD
MNNRLFQKMRRDYLRATLLLSFLWLGGCFLFSEPDGYPTRSRNGVYHTVRPGQTLWGISKIYGADVEQVAVMNGIGNPDRLEAGTRIFIPGRRGMKKVSRNGASSVSRKRPRWARRQPKKSVQSSWSRSAAEKRAARSLRFTWPVRGKVVKRFGSQNGVRYEGIAISAPRKATVRAAARGRVIFSDWGPGNFGRMVIIRHAGGEFHSVYSHNQVNLVKRGQVVRRGAPIARVGATGDVQTAQLHFEIRYRTRPRDPLTYLP